jgi:RNA polymerase sigma-70 factor, ECF subfamily
VDTRSDEELIEAITRSDADALRELYRRHARLVYGMAIHVVGDREAAEEITQDVFVRAWSKAGTYQRGKARVATWLARIARNHAIDVLRRMRTRRATAALPWEAAVEERLPGADDPAAEVLDRVESERVTAAVMSLPPEQRAALALAYYRGYTHREIAEATGEPLGTVKTRIRSAMARLRRELEGGER